MEMVTFRAQIVRGTTMSARPLLDAFFPLHYQRPVWVTGAALTAGLMALEFVLHGRAIEAGANPLWDALYASGYSVYLVPLALGATRTEPSALRRLLFACTALLTAGFGAILLPWERLGLGTAPCLQVSGIVLVILFCARRRQAAAVAASLILAAATVIAMIATGRHAAADVVVGAALGWSAAGFADWRSLSILRRDDPWQAVRHEVAELRSLVWGNRVAPWESAYAAGHWDFLDSADQRPRHYLIAGLLAERLQHAGARVLDAGCGLATLYRLLRGRAGEYVGLDFSAEALQRAEAAYGIDPGVRFVNAPFEQFSEGGFDAVVLNEVLYLLSSLRDPGDLRPRALAPASRRNPRHFDEPELQGALDLATTREGGSGRAGDPRPQSRDRQLLDGQGLSRPIDPGSGGMSRTIAS